MLVPAGVEPRLAGRVVEALGPPAPRLLRDDPWRLLLLSGVTLGDADRVARVAIPGVRRDDSRRSRALVGFVLARQARDGHTISPHAVVVDGLREFDTGSADDAIAAAVDAATVTEVGDGMLALTRYAAGRGQRRAGHRPAARVGRADQGGQTGEGTRQGPALGGAGRAARRRVGAHRRSGHGQEPNRGHSRRARRAGRQVGRAGRADRTRSEAARRAVQLPRVDVAPAVRARSRDSPATT